MIERIDRTSSGSVPTSPLRRTRTNRGPVLMPAASIQRLYGRRAPGQFLARFDDRGFEPRIVRRPSKRVLRAPGFVP